MRSFLMALFLCSVLMLTLTLVGTLRLSWNVTTSAGANERQQKQLEKIMDVPFNYHQDHQSLDQNQNQNLDLDLDLAQRESNERIPTTTPSNSSSSSSSIHNKNTTTKTTTQKKKKKHDDSSFAVCLLLKDDNDILNEWIAYHYHVLNLRRIIVAVDPASQTSPSDLFKKWRNPDTFGMTIDEWHDANYLPDYFLQGQFDKVPSFLPIAVQENASTSVWHKHQINNLTQEQIQQDLLHINNHRFRQVTFVSHCLERLKRDDHTWVGHFDTDEYLVVNPKLRARPNAVEKKKKRGDVTVPTQPTAGSILQFLEQMLLHYPKRLTRHCIMMPTVLFGAFEEDNDDNEDDGNTTTTTTNNNNRTTNQATMSDNDNGHGHWNLQKFESLRWKYHADWNNILNGMQKAILDVSTLPLDHSIFVEHRIKSVHQPLDHIYNYNYNYNDNTNTNTNKAAVCRRMTLKPEIDAVRLFPLTINHYVGSLERYQSRQDVRRNIAIYQEKAQVHGVMDDGWIASWLSSFVQQHGMNKVQTVLGDYRSSLV